MIPAAVFEPGDYVSPANAGYAWSLAIGVGWLGVAFGAFVISLFVRALALSKKQAHEHEEMLDLAARPLSSGPRRVVRGRVELDEGLDVAIEIDVDQVVRNHTSKNAKWHTWNEIDRATRTTPFYLVREDGETIYVEPPDDVLVVDELETKYPTDTPQMRVRFADVRRGEAFLVYGDLDRGTHPRAQGAYRDGAGWILRSPRQRMLLATDAVRDRYRARISYLYLVGSVLAALFVIAQGLITAPFLDAALFGTQTDAKVIDRDTWVTVSKGTKSWHYSVTVETPDHLVFTQDVSRPLFEAAWPSEPGGEAVTIPVLETGLTNASYLGFEPTLPSLWLVLGTIVSLGAILLTLMGYGTRVPWYDRTKLIERGGSGHWVEPRPDNPVVGEPS